MTQPSSEQQAPEENRCHSGSDGDCIWEDCPQEANNRRDYKIICPLYRTDPEA